MKNRPLLRLTAAALSLALLAPSAAHALTLEQAAELLDTYYVDDVPQSVLEQPTINEMLEALGDRYTQYFTPEEYAAFNATMSDTSLVGIGVVTVQTEEGLVLDSVLEGSPAEAGGMQAGDIIVAVDGESIIGEDADTAVGRIQGEEGTQVKVTFLRGGARKTITLTRALVVIAATTTELIDDHIGYIRCTTFGNETVQHFRDGIEKYDDQVSVWIVDLRSNTGGVTQAAVEAAGCFTGPGEMVYLRNGQDEYSAYYHGEEAITIYPVIVLVDEQSASASELFAAAIRERRAGIVIGTRTFGKGVAQTVLDQNYIPDYFPEGDGIKITSHRFFTPGGNSTDQVGIVPDLLVEEDMMESVAYLLTGTLPSPTTVDTLRLDMSWRWYVDLKMAAEEYPQALTALLKAIPEGTRLWLGMDLADGWALTDSTELAELYGVEYSAPVFPDQEDSRFGAAISILKTYDMLHGKEDGLFHPQDTLTRAELCQMLAVLLNCMVPINESPYSDVANDAWYAPAVVAMTNMGLVNGVGNGEFHPEDTVTHEQFITILGRLGQWVNMYLYNAVLETPQENMDVVGVAGYASWAKTSAWLLSYSQKGYLGNTITLLWDSADQIDPAAATTRDEAACAIYQLLSYTGVLSA